MISRNSLYVALLVVLLGSTGCKDSGSSRRAASAPQTNHGNRSGGQLAPTTIVRSGGSASASPGYLHETADNVAGVAASGTFNLAPSANIIPLYSGNIIYGNSHTHEVEIVNCVTGQVHASYALSSEPGHLAYDPQHHLLYAGVRGANQLAKIDLVSHQQVLIALTDQPEELVLGNQGYLFVSLSSGELEVVDVDAEQVAATLSGVQAGLLAYDHVNDQLFSATAGLSPSELFRYEFDYATLSLVEAQHIWGPGNGQSLSVSPDGTHIVFSTGGGQVLPDMSALDLSHQFGQWNTGSWDAVFSADGRYLIVTDWHIVSIWNVGNHVKVAEFSVPATGGCNLAAVSRGNQLAYSYGPCQPGLRWFKTNLP